MTKSGFAPLRKAGRPALVDVRAGIRVRTVDARWRAAFEAADVVSEGAAMDEPHPSGSRVWYGSTSIIIALEGELASDEARAFVAAVAERDLHARTRALRVAVREATARALADASAKGSRLGRSQCEIRVSTDPRGVRIDVDVQAPLIESRARERSRAR